MGFGLCDGATALELFGAEAGIDSIILANPWLVEAEAGAPPPAAIKQHYRDRLMSIEGWKKLLSGSVSYKKLLAGVMKVAAPAPTVLAGEVAAKLSARPLPLQLVLARKDGTAIAAQEIWQSPAYQRIRVRNPETCFVESDSHTFARPGHADALLRTVLQALRG